MDERVCEADIKFREGKSNVRPLKKLLLCPSFFPAIVLFCFETRTGDGRNDLLFNKLTDEGTSRHNETTSMRQDQPAQSGKGGQARTTQFASLSQAAPSPISQRAFQAYREPPKPTKTAPQWLEWLMSRH